MSPSRSSSSWLMFAFSVSSRRLMFSLSAFSSRCTSAILLCRCCAVSSDALSCCVFSASSVSSFCRSCCALAPRVSRSSRSVRSCDSWSEAMVFQLSRCCFNSCICFCSDAFSDSSVTRRDDMSATSSPLPATTAPPSPGAGSAARAAPPPGLAAASTARC